MLTPAERFARLVEEVRHHVRAPGERVEQLRKAYLAIEEYAEMWGRDQEWCDRLMTRLLENERPTDDAPSGKRKRQARAHKNR